MPFVILFSAQADGTAGVSRRGAPRAPNPGVIARPREAAPPFAAPPNTTLGPRARPNLLPPDASPAADRPPTFPPPGRTRPWCRGRAPTCGFVGGASQPPPLM